MTPTPLAEEIESEIVHAQTEAYTNHRKAGAISSEATQAILKAIEERLPKERKAPEDVKTWNQCLAAVRKALGP